MILARRLMMCLLKAGWGEWILNPAVTVNTNGIAHYTAYKTNQREYYDSYANLDLTEAIVRSLHDENMQQWQAVIDACNAISGGTDWVFDGSTIKYANPVQDIRSFRRVWSWANSVSSAEYYSDDPAKTCLLIAPIYNATFGHVSITQEPTDTTGFGYCYKESGIYTSIRYVNNPLYNSSTAIDYLYIPFEDIALKIISNASSPNQGISLLAEAYLENVAQSIFSTDESKQFVKLSDLIDQFEENKASRV